VAAVMRWRSGDRLAGSSGLMMGVTEKSGGSGAARGETAILVAAARGGKHGSTAVEGVAALPRPAGAA
jgi:hypothetical protein